MNSNPLKLFVFVFCVSLAALRGSTISYAQDDNASDDQTAQQTKDIQTQKTLNQIHDLVLKMKENAKRLEALEKAVNQADTDNATAETEENNSAAQIAAEEAPIKQLVSAPPEEKAINEIKAEPVDVLPQLSVYYPPSKNVTDVHTFELAQDDFYSSFKEPGNGNDFINHNFKRSGGYYGLYGAYYYRPLDTEFLPINVFHVDIHGDYGVENYNYPGDGKINDINSYIAEPRLWLGKDFMFNSIDSLTPYIGVGYRWDFDQLKNKFSDSQDDDGGNNIGTQYFYIPVGAELALHPIQGWRVDMNGEYDYLAWGRITNYSSDFTVDSLHIKSLEYDNTLRHGYGFRGSFKITKEGDSINYFLEPYIRYWNMGASNTVTAKGYIDGVPYVFPNQEAKNHTTEIGARAGVEF